MFDYIYLMTTSGLSILLHGDISLQDATSCDKFTYMYDQNKRNMHIKY